MNDRNDEVSQSLHDINFICMKGVVLTFFHVILCVFFFLAILGNNRRCSKRSAVSCTDANRQIGSQSLKFAFGFAGCGTVRGFLSSSKMWSWLIGKTTKGFGFRGNVLLLQADIVEMP